MRNLVTVTLAALAIAAAIINGSIIALAVPKQTDRDSAGDWVTLLLPVVVVFLCLVLNVAVLWSPHGRRKADWIRWGASIGGLLFLLLLSVALVPNYELIGKDGTAYWGCAFIPSFWLGIPLLLIGAGVGCIWAVASGAKSSGQIRSPSRP